MFSKLVRRYVGDPQNGTIGRIDIPVLCSFGGCCFVNEIGVSS